MTDRERTPSIDGVSRETQFSTRPAGGGSKLRAASGRTGGGSFVCTETKKGRGGLDQAALTCPRCGCVFCPIESQGGKPMVFCSSLCRKRAQRARWKKARRMRRANEPSPLTQTVEQVISENHMRGKGPRPHASVHPFGKRSRRSANGFSP